jgi:hypothetical protein
MTFTKKKLAAAMTGTLLASVGVQTTQAAVDLDVSATTSANPLSYASEAIIPTAGLGLTDGGTELDIVGTMNANQIASDTDIRVTLTLSSGVFTTAPTMTIDNGAAGNGCDGGTSACPATTIFTGGTTADSTVTFNTNSGTGVVDPGAHFNFNMGGGVTVTDQSAITATVDVQIADNFGPTDLPGASGSYLGFAALMGLQADALSADGDSIDVVQNSLFFSGATGENEQNVGGFQITVNTAGPLSIASSALTGSGVVGTAQATITAANGFAAFNQGTSIAGDGIFTGSTAGASGTFSTADATIAVMAAYTAGAATDAAASNDVVLTIPAANTVVIDETTLTATIAVTGAATSTYDPSSATGTVSLQSLARNGSSARLTFATNPDSPYPMMIRVTNPSTIAGPVTLTLTNDDGVTSSSVSLVDIAGGPTGDLAAGASTALLNISDVFAAVQAADASFELGASNKLRVSVVAEFGTNGGATAVVLNAFSLSSDSTTFSMVTDAGA